jgi:UDP-N-acetylglucosamine 2-epimerase (non-hydrolysing)
LIRAITKEKQIGAELHYRLVHTGQHYDAKMSDSFFSDLNIPLPDVNLECGGGSQAQQTASIMVAFEKELTDNPADMVIVVGDVTSTMACSIVAKKSNTKVAHIEAGIRSYDLSMPEEINRMVTDSITDYFFTTTEWAGNNLRKAGIQDENIFFVGNVMIDTLMANRSRFIKPQVWEELNLEAGKFIIITLHRPSNVDDPTKLKALLDVILSNVQTIPVIFPMHPRTARMFAKLDIQADHMHIVEPMGYLEFNYLVSHAKAVITDSGGITEEATIFGVPCLTLRDNTERPETCEIGTNELVGTVEEKIAATLQKLFDGNWKKGGIPPLWDGHAADRIVKKILSFNK